jgi:threonine/homoserine/homoserine lactone efflux protein
MTARDADRQARAGRRAALVVALSGLFFVLTMLVEAQYPVPNRIMALLNLAALAGFGVGLWMTWTAWRAGRDDKG